MNRQEFFDRVTTPNPTYKRALTEFAEALQDLQVKVDRDLPIQLQATEPDPHYFDGVVDRVSQTATTLAQFLEQPELKGKKIVAVGGAFSAGKSSLINALIGEKRLVAEVDPTTSVPSYVCAGPSERITAINLFQQQIELSAAEFASLTHDEHSQHGSQIGGLLRSVTVQTPNFAWPHLALLDTPGYSKPGEAASSERTDAEIARDQLNAADYILWVVSAAAGAMSADELEFLRSLKPEIPKLLVISRADSKPAADIAAIQALMAETLKRHQIEVVDVVVTSARKQHYYSVKELESWLGKWNLLKNFSDTTSSFSKDMDGVFCSLMNCALEIKNYNQYIYSDLYNNLRDHFFMLEKIIIFNITAVKRNISIIEEKILLLNDIKNNICYKKYLEFLGSFDPVNGKSFLYAILILRSRLSKKTVEKLKEHWLLVLHNKYISWEWDFDMGFSFYGCFKDFLCTQRSDSLAKINSCPSWLLASELSFLDRYGEAERFKLLSANTAVPWSRELVLRLREKLCWDNLSENCSVPWDKYLIDANVDLINWSKLSLNSSVSWNEKMIVAYFERLDWKNISLNSGVDWNFDLISKYSLYIDFSGLSENNGDFWTNDLLECFEEKWDWEKISSNPSVPWGCDFLEKNFCLINFSELSSNEGYNWSFGFIELNKNELDWRKISSNKSIPWSEEFITKYADRLSWTELCKNDSIIWNKQMLDCFFYKINWENLCRYSRVPWDLELLKKLTNTAIYIGQKFY